MAQIRNIKAKKRKKNCLSPFVPIPPVSCELAKFSVLLKRRTQPAQLLLTCIISLLTTRCYQPTLYPPPKSLQWMLRALLAEMCPPPDVSKKGKKKNVWRSRSCLYSLATHSVHIKAVNADKWEKQGSFASPVLLILEPSMAFKTFSWSFEPNFRYDSM